MSFSGKLIAWYKINGRDLPWRQTNDPYVIWLSEIILQQTRVEQGRPYFERFVDNYPTVASFAAANEEDILRLWQGLGYYSRARNMHKAAKMVMDKFAGIFPTAYVDVIQLPGVGAYTAAAISSFSSNEDQAVLDGNVFRVLSRYFAIDTPINTGEGKKLFQTLVQELLPLGQAALFNQAIMDFGATECKPKAPRCATCIFHFDCIANREGRVEQLPVKIKGAKSRNRYFHYFIIEDKVQILMRKRPEGDVWANLYEFPMLETEQDISVDQLVLEPEWLETFPSAKLELVGETVKHVLSHQNIYAKFYIVSLQEELKIKKEGWDYVLLEKLDSLAKHKLIFSFIDKYFIN